MKKLILLILLLPTIAFAQSNKDKGMLNFDEAFVRPLIYLCGKEILKSCDNNKLIPIEPINYSCLKPDGDWLDGVNKNQCIKWEYKWVEQK